MAQQSRGRVMQVMGPVVDLEFPEGQLPEIYDAVEIPRDGDRLVVEVQQHLGGSTVRCVSMGSTDGLARGMKAVNTGAPPATGRRVAVIGGGNNAVDAARSAWRAGAAEVHLLYCRTADLMPALASEVEEARREGVQFHWLSLPVRLLGDGRVQGLVAQKTESAEPGGSGRLCPMPVAGSEFTLEVDTVITAVGETADFSLFGPGLAFDTATIFRMEADPVTLATRIPGVFAGGDLVTGPQSAVSAFAAGRRAALAIHASLQGEPQPQELPPLTSRGTNLIVDTSGAKITCRQPMPKLSLAARANQPDAEVELNEAIEWYESREPGLGLDFAAQVHAAIQRALTFPLAWQEMGNDIRRALVHRFPYGVLYVPDQAQMFIIAVMHLHRQPGYWQGRTA